MKNCPFCNERINDEALKCQFCQQWLVDITKRKKKSNIVPWILFIWVFIGMYHGLVIKAMRTEQARKCFTLGDSTPEYAACKEQITYWNTCFDFQRILQALN